MAIDVGSHAHPRLGDEGGDRQQGSPLRRRRGNGTADGVLTARLGGAGQRQHPVRIMPRSRAHIRHLHDPLGERAGLVEHGHGHPAGALQHLGTANEDSELGTTARSHHQGHRGRKAEGTRA